MAYDKILQLLTQHQVPFKMHEHEAVRTIEDAEDKAPGLVRNLIKTIAFQIKDGEWVLAGMRSGDRVDYRKLAAVLGVNRRQLRSLSPEQVQAELGFEIGGVGPFPVKKDVKVIFDQHLNTLDTIYCGSGKNTKTLELRFGDLLTLTDGEVHGITR